MKRTVLILILLLATLSAETIQRDRTALRRGPGAWYPMIAELSKGTAITQLSADDNWIKVSAGGEQGYIAAKALVAKTETVDVFAQMAGQSTGSQVSHGAVTAAVKGFADRFSKRLGANSVEVEIYASRDLDLPAYEQFRSSTISAKDLKKLRRKISLPKLEQDREFTFTEEGTGLAIAAKLGSMGLVRDPDLNQYVNFVGTYVAEQSQGYDIDFRFFILDQPGVNGYACPGGVIFITRGALEIMDSEAELACFLGHEIAHVIHRHGMKEMEERKEMIMADNVFEEMAVANEVTDDIGQASLDLDDLALNSYETIFQGRLQKYESSADEAGLRYASRSGYDLGAMLDFLKRVGASNAVHGSEHYSNSQNQERMTRLKPMITKEYESYQQFFRRLGERFHAAIK